MKNKDLVKELLEDLKKEKVEIDYSLVGLKFNPFPVAGLPRFSEILPPLEPEIDEKIRHFIKSTYKKGEYGGLTIIGSYGMGKTHLLKYIQSLIDKLTEVARANKIDFSAVTCFIDRPEDTPQRVVHKIIEDIGLDKIRKYVWAILINKLGMNETEFYEKYRPRQTLFPSQKEKWQELFDEPIKSNYLEFLKRFRELNGDFKKLQEDLREVIKQEIVNDSALADRYLNLILFIEEKEAEVSWDILAGYISKRDIQRKEIIFLNSIVKILEKVGFKHLYVFVDEFEDIGKLSAAKKTNYLLTLVTLINRERHWSVIVSLTKDVLEEEIKSEPPLYDRLTTTTIELKPLDKRKGEELLVRYLNLARDRETSSLLPFSEECVKRMVEISEGNYRSFLLLAYNSIEIALKDGKSEINKEVIEKAKELRGV
jgi:Cdc6-like AAA superfamily ATPase